MADATAYPLCWPKCFPSTSGPGPKCAECGQPSRLCMSDEVPTSIPRQSARPVWFCLCGAYVGCHPDGSDPLGTPAGRDTRQARSALHELMDPLWKNAWLLSVYGCSQQPEDFRCHDRKVRDITKAARERVYAYLACRLGLSEAECHVGLFDLRLCRQAFAALANITYREIREWEHARQAKLVSLMHRDRDF